MMPVLKSAMLVLALAASAPAAAGQIYKWTDENGVVNYTPYPPPASARNVQEKHMGSNSIQTSGIPYGLGQAVKNFPVTLYSSRECGSPCEQAVAHLKKRGVPYTEKNPGEKAEMENYKRLSGGEIALPLMAVGELTVVKGYLASTYDAALDQAGYPATSVLPRTATLPMPAAAPVPAPAPVPDVPAAPQPAAAPESPPGF